MTTSPENIRFVNPPTIATPPGYTHVVEVVSGRTVFIAGQVVANSEGNLVGAGDFRAQTQQVFENLRAALEAVGATFAQVVKLTIFTTDIAQVMAFREVRDLYVNTQHPPASTLVEVRRLFRDEFLIEIEAVAVLPA